MIHWMFISVEQEPKLLIILASLPSFLTKDILYHDERLSVEEHQSNQAFRYHWSICRARHMLHYYRKACSLLLGQQPIIALCKLPLLYTPCPCVVPIIP